MSNEITIAATLQFAKGVTANLFDVARKQLNLAGTAYVRRTFSAPTSATALPLGDVATPGWFLIYNTDPTNYVEVFTAAAGVAALKILPGEFAMGRFSVAAPALRANTAAVVVDYLLIDT